MAENDRSNIDARLRADADRIVVEVSPQLRSRIEASVNAAAQLRSVPGRRGNPRSLWWASGLTGVAAAILVIAFINWNERQRPQPVAELPPAITVPPPVTEGLVTIPLKARTADLTAPLEEELVHLQSDLEKARRDVERDIPLTF